MSFQEALAGSPPAEGGSAVGPQTEPGTVPPAEPQQDVNGGGQRQSDTIPYERFKEVNDRYSALNQTARALGYDSAEEYLRAAQAQYQQPEPDYGSGYAETSGDDAPWRQDLQPLQTIVADLAFERAFSGLKEQFPMAREKDVRRSLMHGEFPTVEAAMEANHREMETLRQQFLAERTQVEQQRQAAGAEGAGGGQVTGAVDWANMPAEEFDRRQQQALREAYRQR